MAGWFVPLLRVLGAALGLDEALRAAAMPRICRAGLGSAELIQQTVLRQCWRGSRHLSPPVNLLWCLTPERFCPSPGKWANCLAAWWGAGVDASFLPSPAGMGCPWGYAVPGDPQGSTRP